jgi:hypothetical protein
MYRIQAKFTHDVDRCALLPCYTIQPTTIFVSVSGNVDISMRAHRSSWVPHINLHSIVAMHECDPYLQVFHIMRCNQQRLLSSFLGTNRSTLACASFVMRGRSHLCLIHEVRLRGNSGEPTHPNLHSIVAMHQCDPHL